MGGGDFLYSMESNSISCTYKGTSFEEKMMGSFCYALDPKTVL